MNSLNLKFDGIFALKEPFNKEEYKKQENGLKRQINGNTEQPAKKLLTDTIRKQDKQARAEEIYKEYQKNIMLSSQIQTEILKGLKAGEDIKPLFLKAIKVISLMTSNSVYYNQVEKAINNSNNN